MDKQRIIEIIIITSLAYLIAILIYDLTKSMILSKFYKEMVLILK